MSSFYGLYTVRSGLDAARRALDVVGQNVSNTNTAGYSRQEVSFVSAEPPHVLRAGRGISETMVMRYRDDFLDRSFRTRSGALGYYESLSTQLTQVETVVGDLSDTGMRQALDQFFSAWDNLAMHPSDAPARAEVVLAANSLVSLAKSAFTDLMTIRQNADEAIRNHVDAINETAGELADLNRAIKEQEVGTGQKANDLRDQRDRLLDSLAKLAGTTSVEQSDGSVTLYLNAMPLVDRNYAYSIDTTTALEPDLDADPVLASTQQKLSTFTWNGTTTPIAFADGAVGGLVALRDQVVPDYMKYIDNLMRTVATEVNTLHTANDKNGTPVPTPVLIFTNGTGAGSPGNQWLDMMVNPALQTNPGLLMPNDTLPVPPATLPASSDGERALKIARLKDKAMMTGAPVGTRLVSASEYLRSIHTVLGLQVQDAQRQAEASTLSVSQADKQRQSVSGVSLDDEMTKMIQFQQTYNAAARVMTSLDEMLDVLINRTGVAGR